MEDYKYKQLINPINLFKNSQEIHNFCKLAKSKNELKAFEFQLVQEELYEWANIVKKYLLEF